MTAERPIRALIASEFWAGATACSLMPALQSSGWEVQTLDVRDYIPNSASLTGRLRGRLRRQGRSTAFNRAILAHAQAFDPDVFLTVKGADITAPTLRKLQSADIFCANFYPDYHFNDISIDIVASYDLIATTKSFQLDALRERAPNRVVFVHHGYSDEYHRASSIPRAGPGVDILYIGNAGPAKIEFMTALVEALPGVSIRLVGAGWAKATRAKVFREVEVLSARSGDAYAEEVSSAKIVLAFHNGPDPKTGYADLVSTRSFEIPACGGFMLHVDNEEIRSLYDVPSEIDTFTTPDNCAAKIRYWLAHPEERVKVASRGFARAVPAYGYAARGRELMQMIEARLGA